ILLTHGEDAGLEAMHKALSDLGLDGERIIEPTLDDIFDLMTELPGPRLRPGPRRLRAAEVGRFDWHNDFSKLWLDISEELDRAADDRAKNALIRRLRHALEERERR